MNIWKTMIKTTAFITRRFHPRGTERVLRLIHHPDKRQKNSIRSIVEYDGFKVNIDTASFIEWIVFFKGTYEPEIANIIKKVVRPESVSVDVGANIGLHTLLMSRGKTVIAIEPQPRIVERLRANLRLNGIQNVEILECLISDQAGEIPLYPSKEDSPNKGTASLYKDRAPELSQGIPVKAVTLDSACKNLSRLDLIKMDTEGHDMRVIESGRETIKKFRPVLIFEYDENGWKMAGRKLDDAKNFFQQLGYSLFEVGERAAKQDITSHFCNIIAHPS